jgi:DNA-binding winged helix-turn-helix (wHTH) protein
MNPFEDRFLKGDYLGVLEGTADSPRGLKKARVGALSWIVGAHSFLGRTSEAEIIYQEHFKSLSATQAVACRFFIAIGLYRQSQYGKAREYFAANLKMLGLKPDRQSRFFIYQGLAFNRYFSGRYPAAGVAAEKAFEAAVKADFLYGKTLAADMSGHILIQTGKIPAGLKTLRQAEAWAGKMGNAGLVDAIQVSQVIYQAQFGFSAEKGLTDLKKAVKRFSPERNQDTYSKSSLLLELARQHTLCAQPEQAVLALDRAGEIIYASQNRRHEVILNLRYAQASVLQGDSSRALSFVRSAQRALDPNSDRALEVQVLGMELKLVDELKMTELRKPISEKLARLTPLYGDRVARRISARAQPGPRGLSSVSSDPTGDLADEVARKGAGAIDRVLESGKLQFLYDLMDVPKSAQLLDLDRWPGMILTFDRGQVICSSGLTPLMRELLAQIAGGFQSKKELIEKVWGYPSYHPLRNDPVIYSAIGVLRKLLGIKAHWIQSTEGGYSLDAGVRVKTHSASAPSAEVRPGSPMSKMELNLRQHKLLRLLTKSESMDVRTYRKLFKVSEITASRDLSDLTEKNRVARVGRGRATQYVLPEWSIL